MFIDDIDFYFSDDFFAKNSNRLVDESLGYIRGNMFKNEYIPYKNFKERNLVVRTEEEELLLRLNEAEFALNDISLYLDLHPEDREMNEKFKSYVKKYNDYIKLYTEKYRPLIINKLHGNDYEYYKNPWPWDNNGGVKYV